MVSGRCWWYKWKEEAGGRAVLRETQLHFADVRRPGEGVGKGKDDEKALSLRNLEDDPVVRVNSLILASSKLCGQ